MLIDWFTVAAQIVNFLILVWLLKRFLYAPILAAIDERERRIAAQIAEAAAAKSKAEADRASYEARARALDAEREQLLSAARKAASEERALLVQQAGKEAAQLRERLTAELVEHRDELTRSLGARLETDLIETARRLVTDLSDRNLEEAILDTFVRRLHSLSGEDRERLRGDLARDGAGAPGSGATLRTAFELTPSQRAEIEAECARIMPAAKPLRYVVAPELIGGVELVASGYRLSWNVESYLASLREKVDLAMRSAAES